MLERSPRQCFAALALAFALLPRPAAAAPPAESCEAAGQQAESAAPASPSAGALERGNALMERADPAAALVEYRASLRLARESGEATMVALANANAARAALETGRPEGTWEQLAEALSGGDAFSDAAARVQLSIHIGRSYALLARLDAASRRSAIGEAGRILAQAGEDAAAAGNERLHAYALGYLGELYEEQKRVEDALVLTRRAIYAAQRAESDDALFRFQAQLGRLEVAAGRRGSALAAYRGAVASLRRMRSQAATVSVGRQEEDARAVYGELVDLLLVEASAVQKKEEESEARQALLVEARDALEDLKTAELRDYFRDPCLDAQRKAAPDAIPGSVVIYPVVLDERVELIVSRAGRLTSHRLPVDAATLIAEVRAFRKTLERRTSRAYLRHAHRLYDWMIRPLQAFLAEAAEPETLVFVPDGALRTIPFAALRDQERGKFLIEKHPIAVTPSLTLTDPRPIETGRVRLLAVGITEAVGGYPELLSVQEEIDAIREIYPGVTLMNDGFVVERLERELGRTPYGIVHIASHGEFGGDASKNFLLAYDGRVSMDQLARFVGSTRFRRDEPLELLALSACESAAGDDRAALGLAGVALRAGARSALATLWSVNDQATSELVIDFYGRLHTPDTSRAEALQQAQIDMLSTRHYRHPGYWAPFLLISSWL